LDVFQQTDFLRQTSCQIVRFQIQVMDGNYIIVDLVVAEWRCTVIDDHFGIFPIANGIVIQVYLRYGNRVSIVVGRCRSISGDGILLRYQVALAIDPLPLADVHFRFQPIVVLIIEPVFSTQRMVYSHERKYGTYLGCIEVRKGFVVCGSHEERVCIFDEKNKGCVFRTRVCGVFEYSSEGFLREDIENLWAPKRSFLAFHNILRILHNCIEFIVWGFGWGLRWGPNKTRPGPPHERHQDTDQDSKHNPNAATDPNILPSNFLMR